MVEDNVVCFPAILASGRPWARIVSCNPLELKDPALPPPFSGYAVADRSGWEAYRDEYARVLAPLHEEFSAFCVERGAPPLPDGELIHESAWLNFTLYPAEVDYERTRPLGADLAPARHVRPPLRRDVRRSPTRFAKGRARSSTSRSAASARPTSS